MTEYLVLKDIEPEKIWTIEASAGDTAIRRAAGDDEGTFVAIPTRNITIVERKRPETPPTPPIDTTEIPFVEFRAQLIADIAAAEEPPTPLPHTGIGTAGTAGGTGRGLGQNATGDPAPAS